MKRLKQNGMTSFIILGVMFILLILGLSLASITGGTLLRSQKENRAMVVFQAAQAGLEYQVAEAYAALSSNNGIFVSSTNDIADVLSSIAPQCTAIATVAPTSDAYRAWVTCTVTYKGKTSSIRTLISERDVSIWNNAIFAGTGAVGRAINGNVDIRGSVHILGEGEYYSDLNGNGHWDPAESYTDSNKNGVWDPGEPFVDSNGDGVWTNQEPYNDTNANGVYDPPLTTTELASTLGGNAYIGNNYAGMPSALEALVPTAPRVNGIETLGTEVRVKHGQVSISGSATVGDNGIIDGGTSKGTVDATYVNDGFIGNAGSSSVYSDNGTNNQYDLGHLGIKFPVISGIGADEYHDVSGNTYSDQETFLNAKSLTIPINAITATTPAFSYGPDAYGNSISFTPQTKTTPALLNVTGVVKVNGSLQIGMSKEVIRYTGKGTIYSTQDTSISANFLPSAGTTFPISSCVGILAKRNINIATGSGDAQLSLAGAFYAQGKIVSAKQNQIAGTFVANFYDMGTNVPSIYQVPALAHNMPPGMPGDKNYYTVKLRTWRERL
jgi:Tfp pilus assembly protein PilX